MKTSELTGAALDWAVAKCIGEPLSSPYPYSTNWAFGGPIIERERIEVYWIGDHPSAAIKYAVQVPTPNGFKVETNAFSVFTGPTPLIAAMRCYVASVLGDEVEIPKELL